MARTNLSDTAWYDQYLLPNELSKIDFDTLWELHPKTYPKVLIYGKELLTPRWHQSYGRDYKFSGIEHKSIDMPTEFEPFFEWATESLYGPFNQMLVNWYQDGNHYIGAHRDSEKQLDPEAPILSISLGQERIFRFRNYKTKEIVDDVAMPNNSFIVMGGTTNQEFTHEVPKVNGEKGKAMGRRINITFRRFTDEETKK